MTMQVKKVVVAMMAAAAVGGCVADEQDGERLGTTEQHVGSRRTTVTRWNGGSVSASWGDWNSGGSVGAWRGQGPYSDPNTYFFFVDSGWDPQIPSRRYNITINGIIPNDDLVIGRGSAELRTTAGPNLWGSNCWWDYATWNMGCDPVDLSGGVELELVEDGYFRHSNNGTTMDSYANGMVVVRTQGQWQNSSATATGTVFGHAVTDAPGMFGETQGGLVTREIIVGAP